MLQGAIIGAITGLIVALVMLWMRSRRGDHFLAEVNAGRLAEARARLDKWAPPVGKIPLSKLTDQFDRMAGLTILRDTEALEREVSGHTGNLSAVAQVDALGLIGLALRGGDPAGASRRLQELAERVEREGGAALRLVKQRLAKQAALGRALAGEPVTREQVVGLERLPSGQGKLPRMVLQEAVRQALKRAAGA